MADLEALGEPPANFHDLIIDERCYPDVFRTEQEWRVSAFFIKHNIFKLFTTGKRKQDIDFQIERFVDTCQILAAKIIPLKTRVRGTIAEMRMAKLLCENGITEFEYQKMFPTEEVIIPRGYDKPEYPDSPVPKYARKRRGEREVDLFLDDPIKIPLSSKAVQAFEVKGGKNLSQRDLKQRKEILRATGISTFIVLHQYLSFWEKYGFLELAVSDRMAFGQKLLLPSVFHPPNTIDDPTKPFQDMLYVFLKENIGFKQSREERWHNVIFLNKEERIFWAHKPIKAIMIADDKITMEDYLRRRLLSAAGIETFLSLSQHVKFWKNEGFTKIPPEKIIKQT